MKAKYLAILSVLLIGLGAFLFEVFIEEPDMDDPVLKSLIEQLEVEGYEVLYVESTMLGRYKIEAHSDMFEREIVVAPGAGTYLRDDISPLEEGDSDNDND